jgi:Icc-related predicted phosphoesterase
LYKIGQNSSTFLQTGASERLKILAVSDQVEERLYSPAVKSFGSDVDLLVGCGDLPYEYLEYLLSVLNVPMIYVPGNHDPVYSTRNPRSHVEGGINIDLMCINIKGVLVAGVGGSIRYRDDGINQYGQTEMYFRILKLVFPLMWNRVRYGRSIDLLITHSPPAGIHDDSDQAHQGLRAINMLIRLFKPHYVLHGHTYFYQRNLVTPHTKVGETTVINIFPYHVIDL